MTDRPPFPTVIDSTILGTFRSCPQKAFREYVQHYKPKNESVHLVAGGAYAKGLEMARKAFYGKGQSAEEAEAIGLSALLHAYGNFECPPDSGKSAERTAGALEFYLSRYPFETDQAVPIQLPSGEKAIEFSFAEPLEIKHPESGDPILYCGRMDAIVNYAGGIFGLDDKTTSQLGASWPRQWDLRSQFTGYTWGAQKAGLHMNGFLVRGVSILKTKYDTMEALTYRPQWQIERWYEQTHRDIKAMIQCWESGYWDYKLDNPCLDYGGCLFRQVCLSKDPEPWLEGGFEKRIWNPVAREEIIIPIAVSL
jgi:hypothetical protein